MEKLPTDSPSAANKDSVATRRSPSRTIRENVHTSVLGRDAGDSASREVGFGTDTHANNNDNNNNSNEKKSGWFGFLGENKSETNETASTINNVNRKRRNNNARYDGIQQSLEDGAYDPPPLTTATVGSASSVATDVTPTVATAATREDRVRQECSAFYRGVEEDPTTPFHRTRGRRKGRSSADSNSLLRRMSIRARLSGEVDGALFMSRYEKLNATMDSERRRRSKARHLRGQQYNGNDNTSANQDHDNHDLFLDENDDGQQQPSSYREHIPSPTNNVVMGAANLGNPHGVKSRMFFEQDGKVLMRLPRDQVRLVMDYNLEPGILSVEQWRSQEEATAASEKLAAHNARSRMSTTREREHRRRRREQRRRQRRRRQRRRKKQQEEEEKQQDGEKKPAALETVPSEGSEPKDVEDPSDSNNQEDGDDDDDDDSYSSYSDDYDSYLDDDDDDDDADYFDEDLMPELKYVITIPDDLYRRMVADMSSKLIPPYWGFFKCCHQESERADIRLALVILAVVMFLLFIGSLEWRTT
eukprot:CAMPEP_0116145352 /NCGR_PEP_ID=MMETSP0329-20121206/16542_1 /TAXON_ID=697910 /ORGANISM="Pseudo-nitzschia arenysensis, Strain B593" /LENGTH=530 /DNA_ID=CAMNT_0003640941 /DNA_START=102 /DNA_END=1694 /DNA_ORIENTATION=-